MAHSGPIYQAVALSLQDAELKPRDRAAVQLVWTYAAVLDAVDTVDALDKLGPKLLAALTALGMTPAGRGVRGGGQGGATVEGKLDELRARRQARQQQPAG